MQNNLLSIFKAITPDNIKNIPLIDDSSRIFIELLKENCSVSSDIKIALSEQTTPIIAEELPKIYLYDYYSMIQNLKNNKVIVQKFKNWNSVLNPSLYPKGLPYIGEKLFINYFMIGEPGGTLSIDAGDDSSGINAFPFSDMLNSLQNNMLQNKSENYYVNRLFKQSKGLKKGIKFIYDILNEHLVDADERKELNLQETGNPFEFKISGSIDKDVYRESVAYLSHPLGFTYDYTYISELKFSDDYSLLKFYKINLLEVRCLSGNVEAYTDEVISIIEKVDYLKIIFKNGYYLLQENDVVKYYDYQDNLIKIYPASNHCSIYLDYEIVYKGTLTDSMYSETDLDLEIDVFPDITEYINYVETEEFKNNFLISDIYGTPIGTELISNDSNQYQSVLTSEDLKMLSFSDYSDNYDFLVTDNIIKIDIESFSDSMNSITDIFISTDVLVNNEFNILNVSETFGTQDLMQYIEETSAVLDKLTLQDVDIFDFNFLIGSSEISTTAELISNDSDQFETVSIKDIETIINDTSSSEVYDMSNLNEEFSIELI